MLGVLPQGMESVKATLESRVLLPRSHEGNSVIAAALTLHSTSHSPQGRSANGDARIAQQELTARRHSWRALRSSHGPFFGLDTTHRARDGVALQALLLEDFSSLFDVTSCEAKSGAAVNAVLGRVKRHEHGNHDIKKCRCTQKLTTPHQGGIYVRMISCFDDYGSAAAVASDMLQRVA